MFIKQSDRVLDVLDKIGAYIQHLDQIFVSYKKTAIPLKRLA